MGALGSVQDLEKIIEAANALVSTEKTLEKPEKTVEAAEVPNPNDQSSVAVPEIGRNDPRPDPISGSSVGLGLALKSKAPYFFFLTTFTIWVVSLLAVYLPISGWVNPSFPPTMNHTIMTIFLVSAGLASVSSLLIGLHRLGK